MHQYSSSLLHLCLDELDRSNEVAEYVCILGIVQIDLQLIERLAKVL